MSQKLRIGFLGAGKMATALARGFIASGVTSPGAMVASDVSPDARKEFSAATGVPITASNAQVVAKGSVIIVAVKPGQVAALLEEIKPVFTPKHLLISIAAGVTLSQLESGLPAGSRVIRVMPNTPALVGAGASGYALGSAATRKDSKIAAQLLESVGLAIEFKEVLLDAVTGVSGSGPAFAYLVIEALSDGAVAAGLPREAATRLAAQTLLGAARMVLETGLHPGQLKDMVTSPGGTTIAGLHELESRAVRGAFMSAVTTAADKARALGRS